MTTRSQEAHPGGLSRTPPMRLDTSTKIAVSGARPTRAPARNARPVGLGRGVCNTSTAGMIDSGDSATTSASGMSSVNTEPQLPDINGPFVATSQENVASQRLTHVPMPDLRCIDVVGGQVRRRLLAASHLPLPG